MEAGLGGQIQPQLPGLLRMRQHHAGRLAGHDDLAEIADRGAVRLAAAFDHGHRQAALGGCPGVRDAEHPCAHHDYVVSFHFGNIAGGIAGEASAPRRFPDGRRRGASRAAALTDAYFFFGSDLPS
ncbi:hypothetical protein G6F63_015432 [Rhizopus arrhizus]|nr:hypothetical protein G6F63_015432 [Rhizopus arrhizus]